MSIVTKFALFLCAVIVLMVTPAAAELPKNAAVEASYRVYGNGMLITKGTLHLDVKDNHYETNLRLQSVGPLEDIYSYVMDVKNTGQIKSDNKLAPETYEAVNTANDKTKSIRMKYASATGLPKIETTTIESDRENISDKLKKLPDPLSAATLAALQMVNQRLVTQPFFDGKRVYQTKLDCGKRDGRLTEVKHLPHKPDKLILCQARVDMTHGFRLSKKAKKPAVYVTEPVKVWVAPITGADGAVFYVPLRANLVTNWGKASINLYRLKAEF